MSPSKNEALSKDVLLGGIVALVMTVVLIALFLFRLGVTGDDLGGLALCTVVPVGIISPYYWSSAPFLAFLQFVLIAGAMFAAYVISRHTKKWIGKMIIFTILWILATTGSNLPFILIASAMGSA